MDALRVPTLPIEADVLLAGGERLRGVLRLPAAAAEHGGPPSLAEWLNGPEAFFPFQLQGREDCVILNKWELLAVSAPAESGRGDTPQGLDVPRRPVTVELEGFRYSGVVMVDLPSQHSRKAYAGDTAVFVSHIAMVHSPGDQTRQKQRVGRRESDSLCRITIPVELPFNSLLIVFISPQLF